LKATLEQITADLGAPEVVFFNAARVLPSTLLEADEEGMIYDFKVRGEAGCCLVWSGITTSCGWRSEYSGISL
jgi:hypothetical protein